nr:MAG TPA: endonuclease [Bacteriophage sp.]
MILAERHIIKVGTAEFKEYDTACFLSKNMYNSALYALRKHFFEAKTLKHKFQLSKEFQEQNQPDYRAMFVRSAQQIIGVAHQSMKSFFALIKAKKSGSYDKPVKLPKYLPKNGRQVMIYDNKAFYEKDFKEGYIRVAQTQSRIPTKIKNIKSIQQIRLVPKGNHVVLEVLYKVTDTPLKQDNKRYASIDLGLNNLATVGSNVVKPFIINGKPLKSINQYYNKEKARLQSLLKGNKKTSKRIKSITNKRNNKVKDYLHKSSRMLVNFLVSNNISTLVIGYNEEWKQNINIGKKNNQTFVNIPFYTFIQQLEYKCKLEGINIILTEESYTSKCSFLDNETIEKHENYLGKRIKRGLFKSSKGKLINADLNGSLNILKKVVGEFQYPIEVCSTPLRVTV